MTVINIGAINEIVNKTKNSDADTKKRVISDLYSLAERIFATDAQDAHTALRICNLVKSLLVPYEGVDYLRALLFNAVGRANDAREALKEELRWFPKNEDAQKMLCELAGCVNNDSPVNEKKNFDTLYSIISPFTMVGKKRLHSLYSNAYRVCRSGLVGNFVECGVAGGGSSGLLASVIQSYADNDVRLFCCDSFSGMPEPSALDVHAGQNAERLAGWRARAPLRNHACANCAPNWARKIELSLSKGTLKKPFLSGRNVWGQLPFCTWTAIGTHQPRQFWTICMSSLFRGPMCRLTIMATGTDAARLCMNLKRSTAFVLH
jgi:hypothetical protein